MYKIPLDIDIGYASVYSHNLTICSHNAYQWKENENVFLHYFCFGSTFPYSNAGKETDIPLGFHVTTLYF
jgi:hypothetical protein